MMWKVKASVLGIIHILGETQGSTERKEPSPKAKNVVKQDLVPRGRDVSQVVAMGNLTGGEG